LSAPFAIVESSLYAFGVLYAIKNAINVHSRNCCSLAGVDNSSVEGRAVGTDVTNERGLKVKLVGVDVCTINN